MQKLLGSLSLLLLTGSALSVPTSNEEKRRLVFDTPFIPCGVDPSGKGSCLVLNKEIYESLLEVPVGSKVEFKQFQMESNRRAVLNLKRFSASEDGDDLDKVVLLRGGAFEDEMAANSMYGDSSFDMKQSSTAFIALSPYGSNGFVEFFNSTFILSTPWETKEKQAIYADEYTLKLRSQAERSLPNMKELIKSFNQNHVSVIFNSVHLDHSMEMPFMDYIEAPENKGEPIKVAPKRTQNGSDFIRTFRVASDIDYNMFQMKGSNRDATSSYYYTLVGNAGSIYGRDFGSDFVSSYLRIYDYPDPYPGSSLAALEYMQRTWNPNSPSRSFAALISAKNLGGGVAYLSTLCYTTYAYAVNGNMVGYYPIPVRSYDYNNWDIYVFLHEGGHVWGAQHTHELNPPVDYCGLSSGCQPTSGTIMSYCHLCTNGMANIDLSFHQRTKDQVRGFIGPLNC